MSKRLIVVAVLMAAACARSRRYVSTRVQQLTREDGSSLVLLSDEPPGTARHPLLVYFDGSTCRSAASVAAFLAAVKDMGYGFATPEKRGVRPGDDGDRCSPEYLATNDRPQRVADGRALVASARRLFPRWDGRLVLAGGSEGAEIAAAVAAQSRETVALIYMAGGGLGQAYELRLMREKELRMRSASDAERAAALAELERAFEAIRAAPTSTQTWYGGDNTFRRWATYLWQAPVRDLVRIDVPIYMVHGARDASTPVESADAIAEEFRRLGKTNLIYHRLDGLDHSWRDASGGAHGREVLKEVGAWLFGTVPPSPAP